MIAIIFSVMNSDKFNAFQKFLLFNILFLISLIVTSSARIGKGFHALVLDPSFR